jgi:plasmid rolling circle replication initiator protein Rep
MLEFPLGHRIYLMSEEQIHRQWTRIYHNIKCYNVEEVQTEVQILFIYQTSSDFSVQNYSDVNPFIPDICIFS